mmetsp:Transcript_54039/g.126843  ORF Transcript_54039/g.126843 Transcript_54039/m.126843 type:complete len:509 (-) Transcript_54039:195-1721(-)
MSSVSAHTSCFCAGVAVVTKRGAFRIGPSVSALSLGGRLARKSPARDRTYSLLACAAMYGLAQKRRQKVAVVGGGPAGMTASRYLDEFGHSPVVFEAADESGGIWAPRPKNRVVYRGLVTNIPTMCMQSFDLDFPEGLTSYITGPELGNYLKLYTDHFNLRRFVRFSTTVKAVVPMRSTEEELDQGQGAWEVTWKDPDSTSTEVFDAVVVATGHYEFPYAPEIPGQSEWLAGAGHRRVVHAVSYDDPDEFKGQSVLIVGGRSSAVDIARELRSRVSSLYVLDKSCREIDVIGTCFHVPFGARLSEHGLVMVEGAALSGDPVDTIILATGYTYQYPFLDEKDVGLTFGSENRYVAPLYQHVIHARRPSLSFVGIPLAVPCPVPLFEAQSYFAASHLSASWTTERERLQWVDACLEAVESIQNLHFLSGQSWDYMTGLLKEAGMATEEHERYVRRLRLVQAIYQDRVQRRPDKPWDDDEYRRCEYTADYDGDSFQVMTPDGSLSRGTSKM